MSKNRVRPVHFLITGICTEKHFKDHSAKESICKIKCIWEYSNKFYIGGSDWMMQLKCFFFFLVLKSALG